MCDKQKIEDYEQVISSLRNSFKDVSEFRNIYQVLNDLCIKYKIKDTEFYMRENNILLKRILSSLEK